MSPEDADGDGLSDSITLLAAPSPGAGFGPAAWSPEATAIVVSEAPGPFLDRLVILDATTGAVLPSPGLPQTGATPGAWE